jgi:malate synthase
MAPGCLVAAAERRGTAWEVQMSASGIEVLGPKGEGFDGILSTEALSLVAALQREFGGRREQLLEARRERQRDLDTGGSLDFLARTADVRGSDWTIAPLPEDLLDRRVEITGPPDRKMVINALNSGSKVFMADFEDSNAPTWSNCVAGQINLRDAVRRTITYSQPGKDYSLNDEVAVLMVRPRGWHLLERHLLVDGEPVSASIFDFSLYLFHNHAALPAIGSGPYFYLPKLEGHLEARLWNDIFVRAQELLGIRHGTIKATVLIETIPAVFEMDEILYELRDHSAGLNCGRWDYIFSIIKRHRSRADFVMPDRAQVTMATHCMHSYSLLAIKTCHRRGAPAIGGMAAQIPIKNDSAANRAALDKVLADKERESRDGHDGTWVAHPGLVPLALEVFDANMPTPNQIHRKREDVEVTAEDLLRVPDGTITEEGLRINIDVGIQYLEAWLGGNGCVPIYNLMEDTATAEISRTQVWQWVQHSTGVLDDGREVTAELVRKLITDELDKIRARVGDERCESGNYDLAAELFEKLATQDELEEFLTLVAYEHLE